MAERQPPRSSRSTSNSTRRAPDPMGSSLRKITDCVEEILSLLCPDDLATLEAKFDDRPALIEAMCTRGSALAAHLAANCESVGAAECRLLAAATLTTGSTGAGVHTTTKGAAMRFGELLELRRRHPDLEINLMIRAGHLTDDEIRRLQATADAVEVLRIRAAPTVAADLLTMVTAAVVSAAGSGNPETTAKAVVDLVDRALADAARYRAHCQVDPPEYRAFTVLGNVDFVVQAAALRTAVAHAVHPDTVHPSMAESVAEVSRLLRAFSVDPPGPSYWNAEPDIVLALFALARFVGGGDGGGELTEKIFRLLHPEISGLVIRKAPRPGLQTMRDAAESAKYSASHAYRDGSPGLADDVDRYVGWAMAALYSGTSRAECDILHRWLVGRQVRQQDMMFLLDRLRRLDSLFRVLPDIDPPAPDLVEGVDIRPVEEELSDRISAVIRSGSSCAAVPYAILVPLWSTRWPVIKLASRYILAATVRKTSSTPVQATVAAAVVVRAPHQYVERGGSAVPSGLCACGARSYRGRPSAPAAVDVACPHRTWEEPGIVESYATLSEASNRVLKPDAVRQALRRYDGPCAEWVREIVAEEG